MLFNDIVLDVYLARGDGKFMYGNMLALLLLKVSIFPLLHLFQTNLSFD